VLNRPSIFDVKYDFALPGEPLRNKFVSKWIKKARIQPVKPKSFFEFDDAAVAGDIGKKMEGQSFAFLKELSGSIAVTSQLYSPTPSSVSLLFTPATVPPLDETRSPIIVCPCFTVPAHEVCPPCKLIVNTLTAARHDQRYHPPYGSRTCLQNHSILDYPITKVSRSGLRQKAYL